MEERIRKMKENLPSFILPIVDMSSPNDSVTLHDGPYNIIMFEADGKESIPVVGTIEFKWFPTPGCSFRGLMGNEEKAWDLFNNMKNLQIEYEGGKIGQGFLLKINFDQNTPFKGVFKNLAIFGDSTIPVRTIKFIVPNLRPISGLRTYNENLFDYTRINLCTDKFEVNLDRLNNYKERIDELNNYGGYHILYSGELSLKKPRSLEDSRFIFKQLNLFLSFLNGRRVSTNFHTGIHDEEKIWQEAGSYHCEIYKKPTCWMLDYVGDIDGLNRIFSTLIEFSKDENDKNFISQAINWYLECNNRGHNYDGALIMAQTALELIYNWLVIEKGGVILGSDAEKMQAANKIRLLLSKLKIDFAVPDKFEKLTEFIRKNQEVYDGPGVIVNYRNAIVHSQKEKRNRITELDSVFKFQALYLAIWYIELSLLYILNYRGKYYNRCLDKEELVPWANPN